MAVRQVLLGLGHVLELAGDPVVVRRGAERPQRGVQAELPVSVRGRLKPEAQEAFAGQLVEALGLLFGGQAVMTVPTGNALPPKPSVNRSI